MRDVMNFILKIELFHALGADRDARNEIKRLYDSQDDSSLSAISNKIKNDKFFVFLIRGLSQFYKLENDKFRIEYDESEWSDSERKAGHTSSNDKIIDRRLDAYEQSLTLFNRAGLSLFETYFDSSQKKESGIDKKGQQHAEPEIPMELVENFITYTCYHEIVKILSELKDKIALNISEKRERLEEVSCTNGDLEQLGRYFGSAANLNSELSSLLREIQAKLMRFKGDDRYGYWAGTYQEMIVDHQLRNDFERLGNKISAFVSENQRIDFICKFLCGLLFKYHVLSHKISESKQYSIFYKRDQNGDEHAIANYALMDSYITYKKKLEHCRKIFTFVRTISKYFPFIFEPFGGNCIADIFQALAYLRRGNTYFLQEYHDKAFNDYNCAQNFLRQKADDQDGEGMNSMSAMYADVLEPVCLGAKGECYRQDYDYENAYDYFCQSVIKFELLNITDYKDSIKYGLRFNLHIINKAKMFMVKGDFRRAIKWYCKCLTNFFALYKRVKINETDEQKKIVGHQDLMDALETAFDVLELTKNDATIHKGRINIVLQNLTDRLSTFLEHNGGKMKESCRLTGLMSDIFNRISMLIYTLGLPGKRNRELLHSLSSKWLEFALSFNKLNGLANYNLMIYRILEERNGPFSDIDQREDNEYLNLKHDGSLFDRYNRHFATWMLLNIVKKKESDENEAAGDDKYKKDIAAKLTSRMFQYTDNFSLKNKEIFKYLTRERTINEDENGISKLFILRRWSSFTPSIPRPRAFYNRGGGFFVVHRGKGIAVDPGFDFIVNLYQEGFSVNDIDAVIITHDHIDHYSDFDTLLTLWHLNKELSEKDLPNNKNIYLSTGLTARYNFLLNIDDYQVYPLRSGTVISPTEQGHHYEIIVKHASHSDLSTDRYSVGFILKLKINGNEESRIGFTGDTKYKIEILREYINCDVILFNISSLPFRELKYHLGLNGMNQDIYKEKLRNVLVAFEKADPKTGLPLIAKQLYYAYWYKEYAGRLSFPHRETKELIECLFSNDDHESDNNMEEDYEGMNLGDHLYLTGILEFNKLLRNQRAKDSDNPQLVIITELKEEIGSFRNKIADEINRHNSEFPRLRYLTGDIGMTIQLLPHRLVGEPEGRIQVACSQCKLNNDYLHSDIFHPITQINDFCIKGENEGIFYLCKKHDFPKADSDEAHDPNGPPKEIFYQRMERYNVFGMA